MFKKFIYFLLISISGVSHASEIKVYWPFSAVSDQGLMVKELVDSMNETQKKYKFVLVHKPGAGGSLAASSVLNEKSSAILFHSSSFYIRPNLYKESHNVENFRMINTFCIDQPLGIVSKKFEDIKDFNNNTVRIGIIPGSITALVARNLTMPNPNIKIIEVPYKGTPESTNDMLGGHIEASVDFIGESTLARLPKDARVLGITGPISQKGIKTFTSQGINGVEKITNSYFVFVSVNFDHQLSKEISEIIYQSINEKVRKHCETAYGRIVKFPFESLDTLNVKNVIYWKEATKSFVKE